MCEILAVRRWENSAGDSPTQLQPDKYCSTGFGGKGCLKRGGMVENSRAS